MVTCSVETCERPAASKGWCRTHYFRVRRTGSPQADVPITTKHPGALCSVAGCDTSILGGAQGLCRKHYLRVHRRGGGDPTVTLSPGMPGERNPNWRGEQIGYTGAHDRTRSVRGPASAQQCEHCGGAAAHWAYGHSCPNEQIDREGLPYSADPAQYVALCVPCHKTFDLGRAHADHGRDL